MGLCGSKASTYRVDEDKLAGPSSPNVGQRENSAATTKSASQRSLRVGRSPSGRAAAPPNLASGSVGVPPNLTQALQSLLSKAGADDDEEDEEATQAFSTGGAALATGGSARLLERHFSQHINSFINRSGTLSRVASRDLSYLPPSAEVG